MCHVSITYAHWNNAVPTKTKLLVQVLLALQVDGWLLSGLDPPIHWCRQWQLLCVCVCVYVCDLLLLLFLLFLCVCVYTWNSVGICLLTIRSVRVTEKVWLKKSTNMHTHKSKWQKGRLRKMYHTESNNTRAKWWRTYHWKGCCSHFWEEDSSNWEMAALLHWLPAVPLFFWEAVFFSFFFHKREFYVCPSAGKSLYTHLSSEAGQRAPCF